MEDFDIFTDEIKYTKPVYTNILNRFVKEIPQTPSGQNYQFSRKLQAEECFAENDDWSCAFHLSEAVSASLRTTVLYREEQAKHNSEDKLQKVLKTIRQVQNGLDKEISNKKEDNIFDFCNDDISSISNKLLDNKLDDIPEPLHKRYIRFSEENNVDNFRKILKELPKEWTIVQLTAPYNANETLKPLAESTTDIKALYISVLTNDYMDDFDMGPLNVKVPANESKVGEKPLFLELKSLLDDNYKTIENAQYLNNKRLVQNYWSRREDIDLRMKSVLLVMEREWLGGWGCLLGGRLIDRSLRDRVKTLVDNTISDWGFIRITDKQRVLLYNLMECSAVFSSAQIRGCLSKILTEHGNPDDLRQTLQDDCKTCSTEFSVASELCMKCLSRSFQAVHHFTLVDGLKAFMKAAMQIREDDDFADLKKATRHPVILIVDEMLDQFPWESLPVLNQHPVSRMENIHFVYDLFKVHEGSIVDGYCVVDSTKGRYVINPEKNLDRMEKRMRSFVEYWAPQWEGAAGSLPEPSLLQRYYDEADLFLYCGHGAGLHLSASGPAGGGAGTGSGTGAGCASVLAGCGSARLTRRSVSAAPHAAHHAHRAAHSPLVIGMLWEVTDLEVDKVVTSLLSLSVPSPAPLPWGDVGKGHWGKGELVINPQSSTKSSQKEPPTDVLTAVTRARRCTNFVMIASSVVARGIPLRITGDVDETASNRAG